MQFVFPQQKQVASQIHKTLQVFVESDQPVNYTLKGGVLEAVDWRVGEGVAA